MDGYEIEDGYEDGYDGFPAKQSGDEVINIYFGFGTYNSIVGEQFSSFSLRYILDAPGTKRIILIDPRYSEDEDFDNLPRYFKDNYDIDLTTDPHESRKFYGMQGTSNRVEIILSPKSLPFSRTVSRSDILGVFNPEEDLFGEALTILEEDEVANKIVQNIEACLLTGGRVTINNQLYTNTRIGGVLGTEGLYFERLAWIILLLYGYRDREILLTVGPDIYFSFVDSDYFSGNLRLNDIVLKFY